MCKNSSMLLMNVLVILWAVQDILQTETTSCFKWSLTRLKTTEKKNCQANEEVAVVYEWVVVNERG